MACAPIAHSDLSICFLHSTTVVYSLDTLSSHLSIHPTKWAGAPLHLKTDHADKPYTFHLVEWHSCTEYDLFWVMRGRGKVQHFWSRHPKNSKISTSCRSVQVCKKCNALWWFLLITRSESAPFLPHESRSVPPSLHRPLSRSQTAKMPLPPFFSQPFKVWHRAGNEWYSF